MVGTPRIDTAEDREAVHHRRLLRQMFADDQPWNARADDAERPAVLRRPVRLGVPGVDVAGAAGHPEQDDALSLARGLSVLGRLCLLLEQTGQGETGHPGEAGFEEVAAG